MAGKVFQTWSALGPATNPDVVCFEFEWTGDASNGSVPTTAALIGSSGVEGFLPTHVRIKSQTPAPTSGYSIRILDAAGIDILEGQGLNIASSALNVATTSNVPPLYGGFSLQVSGNTQVLARGQVVVFFRRISLTQLVTQPAGTVTASAANSDLVFAADYSWSRTGTPALTASVAATIPLSPFPSGITAESVTNGHYVKITDAVGGNESLLIQSYAAGASITVTPASNHTASGYTIGTANGGIQEAIYATSATAMYLSDGETKLWNGVFCGTRKLQFNGAGRQATRLVMQYVGQFGFKSTLYGFQLNSLTLESATTQTGGKALWLTGATVSAPGDGDLEMDGCDFNNLWDCAYADWPGGFVRAENCMWRGIENYAVYCNASTGASAVQLCDNYADGRNSPGLFWFEGTLAGGIVADNWMQASEAHIVINATDGDPVNEFVITGNILDQDSAATGCIVVNGNGVEGDSSNCIKISANFFASLNYGVLIQDGWNVSVTDNHMRQRGVSACVAVAGTTSGKIAIKNNVIECESAVQGYSIQVSATNTNQCEISGNRGTATATMLAFIGVATTIVSNLHILNNSAGANYTRFLTNTGSVGAGLGLMQGNVSQNMPSVSVTAAATITLPFVDESQVVAISATATPITEMNGVLARAGRKVTFLVDGAVTFATSSVADNKLGVGHGPTSANGSVTWAKYSDNLWYVVASS